MLTDLAVTPISATIYRLAAERRSGDLQVHSGAAARMVFFDHGRIVFAASNLKEDRLGEALVELGRITDDDFARVSGLMQEDRTLRFGDALIRAGVMDKKSVGTSVANQVAKIVLSLFRLDTGTASFEERPCSIPLEYMIGVPVQRLLLSGINTMTNPGLVRAGVGDLDRVVLQAPMPPFAFKPDKCPAMQKEVLAQSTQPTSIRQLASGPRGVAPGRLRAVYALLAAGILEDAPETAAAGEPRPQVQSESRGFILSNRAGKPDANAAAPAPTAEPATDAPPPPAEKPREPASVAAAPIAAAPPVATPDAAGAEPVSPEVERLLNQANVCLMMADTAGAMQAYAKVVELAPGVPAYRAKLGTLMIDFPQTLRQAERQLTEALRLQPNDAETHYQLGLYYRKVKIHSRAIAEFRTAVRLDAHHMKARSELAAASPDDNVFTALKKFLG